MIINFSNTSNAGYSSISKTETADIVESVFDDAVHSEVSSVEQKPMLSSAIYPSSQLKRQKRQYSTDNTRLFNLIDQHNKGNPKVSKMKDIEALLPKVNIKYQDGDGDTFLHAAAFEGHRDIIDLLCKQLGVSINIQNKQGDTPLHVAVSKGRHDIVGLLLKAPNININIKNAQDKTALDLANDLDVNTHLNKPNIIKSLNQLN